MLQACDLGHRVVVRHRSPLGATDVLGELVAFHESGLTVRTEAGSDVVVRTEDLIAGKRVPPRPPRYSEIIALELVANRAWPAPTIEALGDWLLRAADGWTNRANSALPAGDAGVPLAEAVQACQRFYRERGLQPKITVPLPVRRDVADHLRATGWVEQPLVLVQTATLTDIIANVGPTPAVRLMDHPSADFLAIIRAHKASLPDCAEQIMIGVPAVRFAEARDEDGTLRAITRGAVIDDWLHIALVEVIAAARRRGLARAASAALAAWARDLGAARAFLQVEERNTAAVALYARLGFRTHHTYATFHPAD